MVDINIYNTLISHDRFNTYNHKTIKKKLPYQPSIYKMNMLYNNNSSKVYHKVLLR